MASFGPLLRIRGFFVGLVSHRQQLHVVEQPQGVQGVHCGVHLETHQVRKPLAHGEGHGHHDGQDEDRGRVFGGHGEIISVPRGRFDWPRGKRLIQGTG